MERQKKIAGASRKGASPPCIHPYGRLHVRQGLYARHCDEKFVYEWSALEHILSMTTTQYVMDMHSYD
jgi:hypothetical protein